MYAISEFKIFIKNENFWHPNLLCSSNNESVKSVSIVQHDPIKSKWRYHPERRLKPNRFKFDIEILNQFQPSNTRAKFHPNRPKISFVKEVNGKEVENPQESILYEISIIKETNIPNFIQIGQKLVSSKMLTANRSKIPMKVCYMKSVSLKRPTFQISLKSFTRWRFYPRKEVNGQRGWNFSFSYIQRA